MPVGCIYTGKRAESGISLHFMWGSALRDNAVIDPKSASGQHSKQSLADKALYVIILRST